MIRGPIRVGSLPGGEVPLLSLILSRRAGPPRSSSDHTDSTEAARWREPAPTGACLVTASRSHLTTRPLSKVTKVRVPPRHSKRLNGHPAL
eukprot:288464-Hanusia_phi.AAC.1